MEIRVAPCEAEVGRIVADIVQQSLAAGARALGLATGSSPLLAYQELQRRHRQGRVSFAGVRAFLLDEYVGLPSGHTQSYAQVIRRELVNHVDLAPGHVFAPDGTDPSPEAAALRCATRTRCWRRARSTARSARTATLPSTSPARLSTRGPGSKGSPSGRGGTTPASSPRSTRVPHRAITQGLRTIRDARHLVLIATGRHKAQAVAAALEGPVDSSCPASVVRLHRRATVVLDDAAASLLGRAREGA